jgi:hypothetical protein
MKHWIASLEMTTVAESKTGAGLRTALAAIAGSASPARLTRLTGVQAWR